jgi:vancomycin permeability regulator SanA
VCLGKTADRAAAVAVVVFADGADAGKNPEAIADEVRSACALYRDGKVHKVVLAGRGESSEETQNTLHHLATGEHVPDGDLLLTATGVEMDASVAATAKLLQEQKLAHVLVTAPFYQLPRIKL